MPFANNIFSLIDMRSFSSVWFWIVLALYWSAATQVILGAPHDLVLRARKNIDPQHLEDLHTLVGIHIRRKLTVMRRVGHWIVAFVAALLTLIFVLAFFYSLEFAQAVFLLLMPMTIVRLLGLRLALRVERENLRDARLCRALLTHRFWLQLLGMLSIFSAAIWGMLQVMTQSVLGF